MGGVRCHHDASHHGGCQGVSDTLHDAPILFTDNLVKKLDNLSTSNIDIYPSTLEICINNLLKLFSLDLDHLHTPTPHQRPPHPPGNHTYAQYFQQNQNIFTYSQCLDYPSNQMHTGLT